VFLAGALGLGSFLVWAVGGLPDFGRYSGPYGTVLNRVAVPERRGTDVVTSVVFDYRGVDTMGEEFILFAAVMGVLLLLRPERGRAKAQPDRKEPAVLPRPGDAARVVGLGMVGPTALLGLYIVAHGYLTPGGGFQGGAVLATASGMLFLAGRYRAFDRVHPIVAADALEGAGAGSFVALGFIALGVGGAFLENVLPLGTPGSLLSAGVIPLLNFGVGVAVAAGFVLLIGEFLEEAFTPDAATRGSP
jgi:multicomponent Na+:H+ antiporter subunit B